ERDAMKKKRKSLIFSAVMIVVCVLLCLLPNTHSNEYSAIPREKVHIDAVDNSDLMPIGIVYSGVQNCTVTVLTGEYKGTTVTGSNYLNSALDKDKLYETGDTAYALTQMGASGLKVTLIDHYRAGTELMILAALAIALIAFGGLIGSGALISLAASAIIIWKLLIPLLLDGIDPIIAAFVTVLLLTALIDLLVAGFTRRCAVALLGSLAGTVTTFLLAMVFTHWLKLDGGDLPYVVPLLSQSAMRVDTRALFIGMMFIANSGALMDLSMDVSVACEEIQHHCPAISANALLKSGFTVGRGVLGTMATTLMLAYSGNYLSMLMYFMGQGTPVLDVINLKYVASQLLNTLVGSFGLVATAPLSALIASAIYTRMPREKTGNAALMPETGAQS
ncbi:MAG: YibE/F family protein, partial [Eubacteriales bacterium]|nr:YibE/F family protein [Eubacteriales bacterium]